MFADEAFGTNDRAAVAVLKMLITEPEIPIEGKGKDIVTARNFTHMIIASNAEWVVPAGLEERRFCVFDVSEAHMKDTPYFAAIDRQMKNNGGKGRCSMNCSIVTSAISTPGEYQRLQLSWIRRFGRWSRAPVVVRQAPSRTSHQ